MSDLEQNAADAVKAIEAKIKAGFVSTEELLAVLAKHSHDIIGRAHALYEDVMALIAKAA